MIGKSIFKIIEPFIKNHFDKQLIQLKEKVAKLEKQSFEIWQMKRDACNEALEIINAYYTNLNWSGIDNSKIIKEEIDIIRIRKCQNQLATTCNNSNVITTFNKIIFHQNNFNADILIDLRQEIRIELGLEKFEENRDEVFLFVL